MPLDRDLLVRYATLKTQEKDLKSEIAKINLEVSEQIKDASGDERTPVELKGYGTFSIVHRKSWTYSPDVAFLEKKLEEAKAKEQATGTAKFDVMELVSFRSA